LSVNNREIVINQILKIIQVEAPINVRTLQKKLLSSWGITRSGARTERYIYDLIQSIKLPITTFREENFVWAASNTTPLDYYRVMPEQHKRLIEDLCPEEIFVCLTEVLKHHIKLEKENAFRYLQKTLLNVIRHFK
jgi:hypothetical protein